MVKILRQGNLCGFMAKMQDCGLEISDFELLSPHYIHFQTDTLGKDMNHLISPIFGLK